MIGYHHVLMIVIAVAVILLCEIFLRLLSDVECKLTFDSSSIGRMLVIFAADS